MNTMAEVVSLKEVVQCLVDGNLAAKLCRICLSPLDDFCENAFTEVCKEEAQYCMADVLDKVCGIQIFPSDNYCICSDCFVTASSAYKFHLTCQRTEEILNFYVTKLVNNLDTLSSEEILGNNIVSLPVCIALPGFQTEAKVFDFNLDGIGLAQVEEESMYDSDADAYTDITQHDSIGTGFEVNIKPETLEDYSELETKVQRVAHAMPKIKTNDDTDDDDAVLIVLTSDKKEQQLGPKIRKKRLPMEYRTCPLCPIKYRFMSKLRDHMMSSHDVELYTCKICKLTSFDRLEYHTHLQTHTNIYTCDICLTSFKKRDTIIAHLRRHEQALSMEGSHVCELCGQILQDEFSLNEHYDKKHDKKYTCFYCGKSYKGEMSFESHIKKHEMVLKSSEKQDGVVHRCHSCLRQFPTAHALSLHVESAHAARHACALCDKTFRTDEALQRHARVHEGDYKCKTCDRSFVDGRSLMWHERLHTNERPYPCEICGRGFVSANRRNSHALCAHTAPSRRCPLCPALFHLRSCVNSHIKKVHLKEHKRRNRNSKYRDVVWRTETVSIPELSIAIQNDVLASMVQ